MASPSSPAVVVRFGTRDTSAPRSTVVQPAPWGYSTSHERETDAAVDAVGSAPASNPPAVFTVQDLGDGRFFTTPLYLTVMPSGESWLALSADLGLVGRGDTVFDAIDDAREQVAELYEALSSMRDTLGPKMRGQLLFLERLAQRP